MYHTIVRRKLHATLAHVSKRNYAAVVDGMAKDDVEHWFSGEEAVGAPFGGAEPFAKQA
jgi:hypothetical protein